MPEETLDAVVVGTGAVGAAALSSLARRGAHVVGLDRFPPGHDRGSSHGATRMIRLAYMEHPDYVPLLRRAFELWEALEARSGRRLYSECGLLEAGPPDGRLVPGVLESRRVHGLEEEVEELAPHEAGSRFRGLHVPPSMRCVQERRAGWLAVEDCVRAHAAEAAGAGAGLRTGAPVLGWETRGDRVLVHTAEETFTARRLVVCAGAWARGILQDIGVRFTVLRKSLFWFEAEDGACRAEDGFPAFFFETSEGFFYGFPRIDADGVKLGEHSGGRPVDDPLRVDRELDMAEQARVEAFRRAHVPGAKATVNRHEVCLYTSTPDEHFVVDRHPEHPEVVFAAGLSGHGFKFAPVLGEALADLALEGRTSLPVGFLGLGRPGLHGSA